MLMVPYVIGKTQREYIISLSSYVDSVVDTTRVVNVSCWSCESAF